MYLRIFRNTGRMNPTREHRVRARRNVVTHVFTAVLVLLASVVAVPAASAAAPVDAQRVKAADLSQFQPGNIVSDAVFYNPATMTEGQIQAFLDSKVSSCRSGYTCLKDKTDATRWIGADPMCNAYPGGGVESAARIIYKVSQACGINPQVLIVMLQKEQGLVTDTWPTTGQYRAAMGQGCPDTAPCDAEYYGFFNQVHGAAWQLKRYANPPGTSNFFTWYAPGRTWNIQYNPNAACGSSPVYIANKATAALYYYTPYQPNRSALAAGYGLGDSCGAYGNRNFFQYFTDWFGSTQGGAPAAVPGSPFGNVEIVQARPGEFFVGGWAVDPDTAAPISVHVYVGAAGVAVAADIARPDVGAAYPQLGSAHGFHTVLKANGAGTVNICVYAINTGPGANVLMACRSVDAMSGSPNGALDSVTAARGGVSVAGWAIDPDTTTPTSVHIYVDDTGLAIDANGHRPDLAPYYPAYGTQHGFATTVPTTPGPHRVCAYAINVGPGYTTTLGCSTVTVPGSADLGRPPFGNFDAAIVNGSTAAVSGWAIDPDTTEPIPVHLYVGGVGAAYVADKSRDDVGAVYPMYGVAHGFSEQLQLPSGRSDVCAYAINTGAGGHTFLGCRSVSVAAAPVDGGRAPFGNLETVTPVAGGATVVGWAIDPDTTASIPVHVYVDGSGVAHPADAVRVDVAAAYPGMGAAHGFGPFVPMSPGAHSVCVYAINDGAGGHTFLGCRDVTVP